MDEIVRYTYRLRPGVQAQRALSQEWGRCRFLWNEAVHQQKTGNTPTLKKLGKLLTELRGRNTWMRKGSQVAQQSMLRAYAQALQQSYTVKGRGRPRHKAKKRTLPSLEYSTRGFSLREGRLRLPKGMSIPVVWSRELPSDPTSVRVYQDSLGHWYASFVVRREAKPAPEATGGIGIDWGVSTTAITTDPQHDLPHLGHRRRCAAELAKAQRTMARRHRTGRKQSKGYQRARREAAKLHKKAARQTEHDSRVWAKKITDNHHLIAVEAFKPTFLAKTTMARKAADAAIGAAKRELVTRAERAGRKVVLVTPAYTTMTCHGCFARAKQRLLLEERVFVCTSCGLVEDRDRNAARVILAVAERGHTSVEDMKHLQPPFGEVMRAV
ncbi:RNA-guided endonuclease InsQ/TnpB family protein [Corynebacterium hylobatis]|uniref:RNA-guided endonuclease InsQ/TnpB family protein n=1 Tax=Corynebacterium hylobatis TaxID=1859290 RepID=UPI0019D06AA7|nr:RNA-guided endonuclease TnpB family protein [Corynebacterium hylobatis]